MDHLAILAKKRKLLSRIMSGEKTIESRWYKFRKAPFLSIDIDDTIYFKESGEPVTAKAKVSKVLFFKELNKAVFDDIISKYGPKIGIDKSSWPRHKEKNYCTLIFLKDVRQIPPFHIDKTGYGIMAAWITVDNINRIKKPL